MHRFTLPALASLVVLTAAPAGAQAAHRASGKTKASAAKSAAGKSASGKSGAAGWRTAYSDDAVTVSIAPAKTQKRADGTYAVRLKWAYAANQSVGRGKSYRTMVETRYVNCSTLTSKPVQAETFDAANTAVTSYAMSGEELESLEWTTRKKGTSSEKAYEAVCKAIRGK